MDKQDKCPIKIQLLLPSKILPTVFTYSVSHYPPEVYARTSINFQRGKDIALKPKCEWLMEIEVGQAVFQSLAHRLNNDLKEEISLFC